MFILIDGNTFYASCEKVFRPDLWNKPVVVLSNNDGCIIALSKEAKALGITMGAPFFKMKELIKKHRITVFSSNFTLYSDFSNRLVDLYRHFFEEIEVYSVDESFIRLNSPQTEKELQRLGLEIHQKALQWVGIPVTLGFGPTKTLAKVAQKLAKNSGSPVFVLPLCKKAVLGILNTFPVQDIWGIGRRYSVFLKKQGLYTAKQFTEADPRFIQKQMGVTGRRIQLELAGTSCLSVADMATPQKSILCSRSFGKKISQIDFIKGALTHNVMTALQKLHSQGLTTGAIWVFIATSRHYGDYYAKGHLVTLWQPTDALSDLLSAVSEALTFIFKPGYPYAKSGVMLLQLSTKSAQALSLFQAQTTPQATALQTLSLTAAKLNKKFDKRLVFPAVGLQGKAYWSMNQTLKSPRYTTCFDEVLQVQA